MDFNLEIAARTAWMEARGDGPAGWQAVVWVLMNRLRGGYGRTLAAVCLKPLQFSCWNSHDPNRMAMALVPDSDPLLTDIRAYVSAVLAGSVTDPTHGAVNYYAQGTDAPRWIQGATFCGTFGKQLFYRNVPYSTAMVP